MADLRDARTEEIEALRAIFDNELIENEESQFEIEIKATDDTKYAPLMLSFRLPANYPKEGTAQVFDPLARLTVVVAFPAPQYSIRCSPQGLHWLDRQGQDKLLKELQKMFLKDSMGEQNYVYRAITWLRENSIAFLGLNVATLAPAESTDPSPLSTASDPPLPDLRTLSLLLLLTFQLYATERHLQTGKASSKLTWPKSTRKRKFSSFSTISTNPSESQPPHTTSMRIDLQLALLSVEWHVEGRNVVGKGGLTFGPSQEEWKEDDGENGAGEPLLHMMRALKAIDVLLVVTRWFGGVMLGADRFKDITNTGKALLEVYLKEKEAEGATKQKTRLRPFGEVLAQIKWDAKFTPNDYIIGYEDRFEGIQEVSYELWDCEWQVEVPMHRVRFIKKTNGQVVWDRAARIDLFAEQQ